MQQPPPDLPPPPPPPPMVPPPAWQNPISVAPPPNYEATLNFRYASFWKRFVAIVIDVLIVRISLTVFFYLLAILTGVAAFATGATLATSPSTGTEVLFEAIYFVLYGGYFVYFWAMGQTPGMRLFGIYVADAATGGSIGFGNAVIRYLGYLLSSTLCFVGLIWAAFDPRKQGWHDKFAHSIVIQP